MDVKSRRENDIVVGEVYIVIWSIKGIKLKSL